MLRSNRQNTADRVSQYFFVLLVIQPFLDVLSFWLNTLGYPSTLTLALRFAMLAVTVLYAFFLAEQKHYYWILLGILAVIAGCHIFACVRASGISGGVYSLAAAVIDLTNYVRVVQLPLFALAFISLLKVSGEKGYQAIERAMVINLFVILAISIISELTGTDPHTYPNKSIGLLGWFYFANSQSAILSMIVPLVVCVALKTRSFFKGALAVTVCFLMLLLFATRLAYLSIFLTGFGTLLVWAINRKMDKRMAAWILVLTILCGAAYPISPMVQNRKRVAANEVKKQDKIDSLIVKGTEEFGSEGTDYLLYAYEEYMGPMVHKFGLEKVADIFHESTSVAQLGNTRTKRINYCLLQRNELPETSRWFGFNFNDVEYEDEIYDVENDFHGVLYYYGYLGLFCMIAFFGYFLYLILWALFKNFKRYFTVDAGACGIALCGGLLHAYATAGVLRRPNATIYLSVILAMIWFLVRKREYPEETRENLP